MCRRNGGRAPQFYCGTVVGRKRRRFGWYALSFCFPHVPGLSHWWSASSNPAHEDAEQSITAAKSAEVFALPVRSPFRYRFSGRVRILFVRVKRPISRACWQRIEAPSLRPSLSLHSKGFMKADKVTREHNPFLLSGKRRWRLFCWIFRRTRRDGAAKIIY